MTEKHQVIENLNAYAFNCPDGAWTGWLDEKMWGKVSNLRLFFTDTATNKKYWFSLFLSDRCRPRDGGFDFQNDGQPGDIFALITKLSDNGIPELLTARKILAGETRANKSRGEGAEAEIAKGTVKFA